MGIRLLLLSVVMACANFYARGQAPSETSVQNPDFVFMVEQAVKAPSGHNTQPWLFALGDDSITIRPNYEKSLPVVDPVDRELLVSLGCAAENLRLAALYKGYECDLEISDDGTITAVLRKNDCVEPDTLFDAVAVRQTNRSIYDDRTIPPAELAMLKNVFENTNEDGIAVRFYAHDTSEFDIIADYIMVGNELQMRNEAFVGELRSWMRFNRRHQNETLDGLSYAAFGAPNLPRFIAEAAISGALNDRRQNRGDRQKIASSSHFVLITTRGNSPVDWVRCGIMLERMVLRATSLGIAHAYMNQPIEVDVLSGAMAENLGIEGEYPMIILRTGYARAMPYSKRRGIEEVIERK